MPTPSVPDTSTGGLLNAAQIHDALHPGVTYTHVANVLADRSWEFGVDVRGVGLRDIVLPGDMKEILNRVITAQKEAEANLIKRREETAAARSQANTARLLAQNPALARIKELELLQDVLAGTKATFVLGRGDLAGQVRALLGPVSDEG